MNTLHNCTAACPLIYALQVASTRAGYACGQHPDSLQMLTTIQSTAESHTLICTCRSGQAQGLPYGEKCLFVANDWHAALVPSFLAAKYRRNGVYTGARSIVAIHNMSHQGVEPSSFFGRLGLPSDW